MSGRLIILPKKSYCPWRPENVERVLRDEKSERERLEREESLVRQVESKQRLATLRNGGNHDSSTSASSSSQPSQQVQPNEHVNLFELEERAAIEPDKKKSATASTGVMPVRLDSVVPKDNNNKDQPFYVRRSVARNDDKCKARMDPMKDFATSTDRQSSEKEIEDDNPPGRDRHVTVSSSLSSSSRNRRHRRRPKRSSRRDDSDSHDDSSVDTKHSSRRKQRHDRKRMRKRHRRSSSSSSCKSNVKKRNAAAGTTTRTESIHELRLRRQERERREAQREAAIMNAAGRGSSIRNDRNRHYQDQFHPSLSRR